MHCTKDVHAFCALRVFGIILSSLYIMSNQIGLYVCIGLLSDLWTRASHFSCPELKWNIRCCVLPNSSGNTYIFICFIVALESKKKVSRQRIWDKKIKQTNKQTKKTWKQTTMLQKQYFLFYNVTILLVYENNTNTVFCVLFCKSVKCGQCHSIRLFTHSIHLFSHSTVECRCKLYVYLMVFWRPHTQQVVTTGFKQDTSVFLNCAVQPMHWLVLSGALVTVTWRSGCDLNVKISDFSHVGIVYHAWHNHQYVN